MIAAAYPQSAEKPEPVAGPGWFSGELFQRHGDPRGARQDTQSRMLAWGKVYYEGFCRGNCDVRGHHSISARAPFIAKCDRSSDCRLGYWRLSFEDRFSLERSWMLACHDIVNHISTKRFYARLKTLSHDRLWQ